MYEGEENVYLITGTRETLYGDNFRFSGFTLGGVVGEVDPFVSGDFTVDSLSAFEDEEGHIDDIQGFIAAENEWARQQVGKLMLCKEPLMMKAFAVDGEIRFVVP